MAWLDFVSNVSICQWFYVMFILNSIISVIMVVRVVFMLMYTKPGILMGSATFFISLLAIVVPVINGAFLYALCDRALNTNSESVTESKNNDLVLGKFQNYPSS
jgi:hypothetical protein